MVSVGTTSENPVVTVIIIDIGWGGPRHLRLRRIWRAFVKYMDGKIKLKITKNPHMLLFHHQALNQGWRVEKRKPNRYCLFAEFDFLPDFKHFLPFEDFDDRGLLVAEGIQGIGNYRPRRQDFPAAWYAFVDKKRCGDLDFEIGGPYNDAGFHLNAKLLPSEGAYPEFCGARIKTGIHLFWERHLHDGVDWIIGAERMLLGEMQEKHDKIVEKWLREAPEGYRRIYDDLSSS